MKNKLPNIILIVMDTVGAKHMSLYGYPRRTTPNLERIAADCTVYTRCYAPSCWTMPSHASMFTGLYPSQHGCFEGKLMLHENVWHLATVLKMLGYRTLGISSNDLISEESGLSRDFDYFKNFGNGFYGFLNYLQSGFIADEANELAAHLEDSKTTREKLRKFFNYVYKNGNVGEGLERAENIIKNKIAGLINPNPIGKSSNYSENTVNLTRKLIDEHSNINDKPFLLFINIMEAHELYRPPLKWRHFARWHDKQKYNIHNFYKWENNALLDYLMITYCNLYDDELGYLDDIVYRIWNKVKSQPNFDDTIIIITSDHGEHLGEKNFYGHHLSLYNELIWVPLIIKFPKSFNKNGTEDRLASLNDIYSTILDIVQSPLPCPNTSVSLLNSYERKIALSQYIYPEIFRTMIEMKRKVCKLKDRNFSPAVLAIMTETGRKIIENRDGGLQIFNLRTDGDENHDQVPTMSAETLENIRHMLDLVKEETSYRDALEDFLKVNPRFIQANLP